MPKKDDFSSLERRLAMLPGESVIAHGPARTVPGFLFGQAQGEYIVTNRRFLQFATTGVELPGPNPISLALFAITAASKIAEKVMPFDIEYEFWFGRLIRISPFKYRLSQGLEFTAELGESVRFIIGGKKKYDAARSAILNGAEKHDAHVSAHEAPNGCTAFVWSPEAQAAALSRGHLPTPDTTTIRELGKYDRELKSLRAQGASVRNAVRELRKLADVSKSQATLYFNWYTLHDGRIPKASAASQPKEQGDSFIIRRDGQCTKPISKARLIQRIREGKLRSGDIVENLESGQRINTSRLIARYQGHATD